MEREKVIPLCPGEPRYDAVLAIEETVRVIRSARGKKNPEDCTHGTLEWQTVTEDFVGDLLHAPDDDLR